MKDGLPSYSTEDLGRALLPWTSRTILPFPHFTKWLFGRLWSTRSHTNKSCQGQGVRGGRDHADCEGQGRTQGPGRRTKKNGPFAPSRCLLAVLTLRPGLWGLAAAGKHPRFCSVLGPCSQHLVKDRGNSKTLAPPLQGDCVPDTLCFYDKIHDTERVGSQRCGLGWQREMNSREF